MARRLADGYEPPVARRRRSFLKMIVFGMENGARLHAPKYPQSAWLAAVSSLKTIGQAVQLVSSPRFFRVFMRTQVQLYLGLRTENSPSGLLPWAQGAAASMCSMEALL